MDFITRTMEIEYLHSQATHFLYVVAK